MIGEFGETFVVDWGLAQASFDADDDSLESIKCTPNSCASFFNIINDADSCNSIDGTRIANLGFHS